MKRAAKAFVYDRTARENIALFFSSLMNLSYSIYNLVLGVLRSSVFSVASAAYYFLVMLIRLLLLDAKEDVKDVGNAEDSLLTTGYLLVIVSVAMAVIIISTVYMGGITVFSYVTLLFFGIYSIFSITRAVLGFFKRESGSISRSFLLNGLRISLALLSLFNLIYALSVRISWILKLSVPIGALFSASLVFVSITVLSRCLNKESAH